MIIVKLRGALGNQMFQYAFGRALSIEKKQLLLIDDFNLSEYAQAFGKYTSSRMYRLGSFDIKGLKLPCRSGIIAGGFKKLGKTFVKIEKIENQDPIFDQQLYIRALDSKDVVLDGHWFSEKYFKKYSAEIKKDFDLSKYEKDDKTHLLQEISEGNSVSLHIRRGDYVTNPIVAKRQNIITMEYYRNAIKYIQGKEKEIKIYIFSDDINWVKQNVVFDVPTAFINGNINNPILDLYLMSKCKHNIIANSSFSWWGAWLNSNKEKIVISPKYWFSNNTPSTDDIIPESWVKL